MNTAHPKVSVITITYNQEKFISQTLKSITEQKTNFPFEVIVSDDASSDSTPRIIRHYASRYPGVIIKNLRKKNVGPANNFFNALLKARGNYIALCEGDDYWTDPCKLQKQFDFLETNPEFALCFHPVKVIFEDRSKEESIYPADNDGKKFTLAELLKRNFIQTNSVLYRANKYEGLTSSIIPGDWYLHLYHAQFGKIGFIDEVMSVYRRHQGGIWWQATKEANHDEFWKQHGIGHLALYAELLKMYDHISAYRDIVDRHIVDAISTISRIDRVYGTKLLHSFKENFPNQIPVLFLSLLRYTASSQEQLNKLNKSKTLLEERLHEVISKNDELALEIASLRLSMEKILNSRSYKTGRILFAPYRAARRIFKK